MLSCRLFFWQISKQQDRKHLDYVASGDTLCASILNEQKQNKFMKNLNQNVYTGFTELKLYGKNEYTHTTAHITFEFACNQCSKKI